MATQSPTESLHSEASCSICLGYFQDPVSIHCGHNFCRACITRCWEGQEAHFSCPQCRQTALQKSFRPSRELANIAEIARQLSPRAGGGGVAGWENLCRQHQEALKLFCKVDQQPICVVCDRSQAHYFHTVVPVEEAAQEYKDQERLLLTQLADLDRAITRVQEEAVAKVSEEMSNLDTLIWEMEGKFQQPASQFLQDIRRLLNSCEMMKFNPPVEISSHLERKLEDFVQKNILVRGTLRKCQASVTLDPATAHPNLHLSEDQKQARGQLMQQDLPDNPERFDFEPCVLGCEGFTSGRHFWEVEVGQGGVWALGVARASVKRKGLMSLTPKEGVWALEAYHSLTSPRTNLRLNPLPRRIRVSLDYEAGRVAFFSTDDDAPILVYTRALFNGERVFPWFKMGIGARLQEITQTLPSEDHSVTGHLMSPLDWLEDLKNEIEKRQAKNTTKFSEEISQLDTSAQGPEEKSLQSDVKSTSSRCGKVTFQLPVNVSPESEERVCHFSWRNSALKETLKKLQAIVTLDPNTAHPDLILSEDRKSVRRGEGRRDLPDNPERFDYWPFVLGCQGFMAGRHCWEVEVGDGGDWAVGVAQLIFETSMM
ncbi:zinc finger protein RFP-like [Grus japonensis]|uniref:Zinc finger protein RFP-like n=1 Tax=Grus japonensis TaxID=30415 RepID=A0ABC9XVX7_GRUJA